MGFFDRFLGKRRDAFMGPSDRDWRSLVPQEVNRVPEDDIGRKRAVRSRLPLVLSILFFVALGVVIYLSVDESVPVAAGRSFRYKTDGFLPAAFVQKVISAGFEGPAKNVRAIKADLETDNQVLAADVRRRADGTLEIVLRERVAVAKIASAPPTGPMVVRLVSPDGQTFAGTGYSEQTIRSLPEIQDFRSTGTGDQLAIEGIEVVGPFLLAARTSYERFYLQWASVSLRDCFGAQEDAPGSNLNVTVRTAAQPTDRPPLVGIIFSTANWRKELALLPRIRIDEYLRMPNATAQAYVLKLSIQNRTISPPVPEPRLVPAPLR
ncbi:MAG: hypothetical protein NTX20_07075 [Verrucomicrobia bacterium]|nr:hypothetical protein [Verrucomicrobiota bacterium]